MSIFLSSRGWQPWTAVCQWRLSNWLWAVCVFSCLLMLDFTENALPHPGNLQTKARTRLDGLLAAYIMPLRYLRLSPVWERICVYGSYRKGLGSKVIRTYIEIDRPFKTLCAARNITRIRPGGILRGTAWWSVNPFDQPSGWISLINILRMRCSWLLMSGMACTISGSSSRLPTESVQEDLSFNRKHGHCYHGSHHSSPHYWGLEEPQEHLETRVKLRGLNRV